MPGLRALLAGRKTDGAEDDGLAFFALGRDGMTSVHQATSKAPASLSKAQLAGICSCTLTTWDQMGGTGTSVINPYLRQSGLGHPLVLAVGDRCLRLGRPRDPGRAAEQRHRAAE